MACPPTTTSTSRVPAYLDPQHPPDHDSAANLRASSDAVTLSARSVSQQNLKNQPPRRNHREFHEKLILGLSHDGLELYYKMLRSDPVRSDKREGGILTEVLIQLALLALGGALLLT